MSFDLGNGQIQGDEGGPGMKIEKGNVVCYKDTQESV